MEGKKGEGIETVIIRDDSILNFSSFRVITRFWEAATFPTNLSSSRPSLWADGLKRRSGLWAARLCWLLKHYLLAQNIKSVTPFRVYFPILHKAFSCLSYHLPRTCLPLSLCPSFPPLPSPCGAFVFAFVNKMKCKLCFGEVWLSCCNKNSSMEVAQEERVRMIHSCWVVEKVLTPSLFLYLVVDSRKQEAAGRNRTAQRKASPVWRGWANWSWGG